MDISKIEEIANKIKSVDFLGDKSIVLIYESEHEAIGAIDNLLTIFPYEILVYVRIDILSKSHINIVIASHEYAIVMKSVKLNNVGTNERMAMLKAYCKNVDILNQKERVSMCFGIIENGIFCIPYFSENNEDRILGLNIGKCTIVNNILEN